jgi:WD40 repeat protein
VQLATVNIAAILRILDADDGRVLAEHDAGIAPQSAGLRFSPDGGRLIACPMAQNEIRLYRSKDLGLAASLRGHTRGVTNVAFSSDGTRLAEVVALHGHEYEVYCLAFTADGFTLISGGGDNTLRFWHAPN